MLVRYTLIIWVIKFPTENDMVYFMSHLFNLIFVIDDHGFDGNNINDIKDLTVKKKKKIGALNIKTKNLFSVVQRWLELKPGFKDC